MKDSFISQGKKYISAKRASEISDYSSDYIGQLCRARKLDCQVVGRVWFVVEESLLTHKAHVLQNESYRNRHANLVGGRNAEPKKSATNVSSSVVVDSNNIVDNHEVVELKEIVNDTNVSNQFGKKANVVASETVIPNVHSSPLKYSSDDRPLLPIISKISVSPKHSLDKNVSHNASHHVSSHVLNILDSKQTSSSKTAETYHQKYNQTYSTLARQVILRRVLNTVVISCLVLGIVTGSVLVSKQSADVSVAQNMSAGVGDIFQSVATFFKNSFGRVLALFGDDRHLAIEVPVSPLDIPYDTQDTAPLGVAVVPSTGSEVADETMKKKIRDSFSDEVVVKPDQSGTAGVITPVFRKAKGGDFVYVLVPVQGSSE